MPTAFEGLFLLCAEAPSLVNVTAKLWSVSSQICECVNRIALLRDLLVSTWTLDSIPWGVWIHSPPPMPLLLRQSARASDFLSLQKYMHAYTHPEKWHMG